MIQHARVLTHRTLRLTSRTRREIDVGQLIGGYINAEIAVGVILLVRRFDKHLLNLTQRGEGLTEGEIARWLVQEGQDVAEDDPLVEIQTDKTTVEIPSPAAGKVARIMVGEGEVVPVGTVLVVIGEDAEVPAPAEPATTPGAVTQGQSLGPVASGRVRATPLVRKIAQELDVDLADVVPTGPNGQVTEADVRAQGQTPGQSSGDGRREALRGVRRLIAEHMARAHREVPPVTWVEECDFEQVELKVLVPTVLKACAAALKEFPELLLGSYPKIGEEGFHVLLTLESRDAAYLGRALQALLQRLPPDAIHRVD